MNAFISKVTGPLLLLTGTLSAQTDKIWFDQPATNWETHALPIGNGSLGAMLFGGTKEMVVQFNEDTLWQGDASDTGRYQAFGHLKFTFDKAESPATDYIRGLHLSTAIHRVKYKANGTNFHRTAFASNPHGALFFHATADKPAQYSGVISLIDDHGTASEALSDDVIRFQGKLKKNGMGYAAKVKVVAEGGTLKKEGNELRVTNANSLRFILIAGTDYIQDHSKQWRGPDPLISIDKKLKAASKVDFTAAEKLHTADHQKFYNRIKIDLGKSDPSLAKLTTEARLVRFWKKRNDPDFEELVFKYGRYLLIASSRPGSMPANLQGLWNKSNTPPWRSDYHSDINVDMNYWLSENTNLSEMRQPFFDYVKSQLPVSRANTKKHFGFNGYAIQYENGVHGGGSWHWNYSGASWFAQQFWDHYSFTHDEKFLKNEALPVFRSVCDFWENWLVERDGGLVAPKGFSAEHGPFEDGVTYDQQFAWDALTNYIDACDVLGVEKEHAAKMKQLRSKLMPLKIGKWGQLQEWLMVDRDKKQEEHRHLSHLIGLYPGRQLTPDSKALYAAAKKSLNARGDGGAGWALPWKAAAWARFNDQERAYKVLTNKLNPVLKTSGKMNSGVNGTSPNLLTMVWGVFQIDGCFGYTGAVSEMLLQSNHQTKGSVHFLPALPKAWSKSGSIKNFKVRGGHTVSFSWKDGKLTKADIKKGPGKLSAIIVQGKPSDQDPRITIH